MSQADSNQPDTTPPQFHLRPSVPYIANNPGLWLAQLETVFLLGFNFSQNCKAVIANLPPDVLRAIRDVLDTVNIEPDPYTAIKRELLQRLAASSEENIAQLLRGEELENRTPRKLLSRMLGLLGSPLTGQEDILRELFLKKLQHHAQEMVAVCPPTTPLQDVEELAEGFCDIHFILPLLLSP
ncbi:UNVERIFIED_CONTAM: hypothetical protein RMT77_006353 [Armadillidium vulgare]